MLRATTIVSAMLVSGPAAAVTCDEFLGGIATSSYSKLLPEFNFEESPYLPGLFNITNLKNISAAYTCKSGVFDGLAATLGQAGRPDRQRWSALIGAVTESLKPGGKGVGVAARLQEKATDAASLEEVKTGARIGYAEEALGDFVIRMSVSPGQIQVQIDPAD